MRDELLAAGDAGHPVDALALEHQDEGLERLRVPEATIGLVGHDPLNTPSFPSVGFLTTSMWA